MVVSIIPPNNNNNNKSNIKSNNSNNINNSLIPNNNNNNGMSNNINNSLISNNGNSNGNSNSNCKIKIEEKEEENEIFSTEDDSSEEDDEVDSKEDDKSSDEDDEDTEDYTSKMNPKLLRRNDSVSKHRAKKMLEAIQQQQLQEEIENSGQSSSSGSVSPKSFSPNKQSSPPLINHGLMITTSPSQSSPPLSPSESIKEKRQHMTPPVSPLSGRKNSGSRTNIVSLVDSQVIFSKVENSTTKITAANNLTAAIIVESAINEITTGANLTNSSQNLCSMSIDIDSMCNNSNINNNKIISTSSSTTSSITTTTTTTTTSVNSNDTSLTVPAIVIPPSTIQENKKKRQSLDSDDEDFGYDDNLTFKLIDFRQRRSSPRGDGLKPINNPIPKRPVLQVDPSQEMINIALIALRTSLRIGFEKLETLTQPQFEHFKKYKISMSEKKSTIKDFSPNVFQVLRNRLGIDTTEFLKSWSSFVLDIQEKTSSSGNNNSSNNNNNSNNKSNATSPNFTSSTPSNISNNNNYNYNNIYNNNNNNNNNNSNQSSSSSSSSESFTLYSSDKRYIMKTISKSDSVRIRKLLPHYYNYLVSNPNAFLEKYLGLYRVGNSSSHAYIVLLLNPFEQNYSIPDSFIYNGIANRTGGDSPSSPSPQLGRKKQPQNQQKSLNLNLDVITRVPMFKQIEKDITFLSQQDHMEYNLVIGVKKVKKDQFENNNNSNNSSGNNHINNSNSVSSSVSSNNNLNISTDSLSNNITPLNIVNQLNNFSISTTTTTTTTTTATTTTTGQQQQQQQQLTPRSFTSEITSNSGSNTPLQGQSPRYNTEPIKAIPRLLYFLEDVENVTKSNNLKISKSLKKAFSTLPRSWSLEDVQAINLEDNTPIILNQSNPNQPISQHNNLYTVPSSTISAPPSPVITSASNPSTSPNAFSSNSHNSNRLNLNSKNHSFSSLKSSQGSGYILNTPLGQKYLGGYLSNSFKSNNHNSSSNNSNIENISPLSISPAFPLSPNMNSSNNNSNSSNNNNNDEYYEIYYITITDIYIPPKISIDKKRLTTIKFGNPNLYLKKFLTNIKDVFNH